VFKPPTVPTSYLKKGDLDGVAVWKRILHAVEECQRVKSREAERANWWGTADEQ
jgi:hypothetical protein